MTRTLVLGASGFVGTALIPLLGAEEQELTLVDRRVDSFIPSEGLAIRSVRADSMEIDEASGDFDTAIVLAGQTDVDEALVNPAAAFRPNVDIAISAAEWLRRHPSARLIYLSTDEVLGPSTEPLGESAALRPSQPYAASKAAAEIILQCYAGSYGLDIVVLRSCNLVGPHQRARKLIPTAVEALAAGKPVPVYGSGTQVREWLSVEDLCHAIVLLGGRGVPAGIYHCSANYRLSTLEVVERVARAMQVVPLTAQVEDRLVHDLSYSMESCALRRYGWEPRRDVGGAIDEAARAMAEAWRSGERLTMVG